MKPEFALPATFVGCPVVAGIYVPRAGAYVPLWTAVEENPDGGHHVGLLRDDGNSIQSWYDVVSLAEALNLMREKADFWTATRLCPHLRLRDMRRATGRRSTGELPLGSGEDKHDRWVMWICRAFAAYLVDGVPVFRPAPYTHLWTFAHASDGRLRETTAAPPPPRPERRRLDEGKRR